MIDILTNVLKHCLKYKLYADYFTSESYEYLYSDLILLYIKICVYLF